METIIRDMIRDHASAVTRLGDSAELQRALVAAGELLIGCFASGGAVYVCGNGGSAADAQHIAGELAGRFLRERPALPCVALSTDTSVLTAVGNDYGFAEAFSRQVEAHMRPGDLLWAISTSGNSENILKAARAARNRGAKVLGFTGNGGGKLLQLCDVCFAAPAEKSYAVQQIHQVAYHILCELVDRQAERLGRK